ncbi:hypothetical protein YC2023_121210 [Brassica napus]
MENRVGFRFIPTDQEIVDYYIRLKNRGGSDTNHVDKAIRAVDICSFDPWELPSKSRRESRDQVWYFFCRKDNRGERQSRKTKSGFWKKTGPTMDIFQKRGDREKIGEKRVLVFHLSGSKSKSDWVMHEYVATFLPPTDQGLQDPSQFNVSTDDFNCFLNYNDDEEEQGNTMFMQYDRNDYRPNCP